MSNKLAPVLAVSAAANVGLIWFGLRAMEHLEIQKTQVTVFKELARDAMDLAHEFETDPVRQVELAEALNNLVIEHHTKYLTSDVDFNDLLKDDK